MKKPKINIEVERQGGEWEVVFNYGNQYFTLRYGGTKAEAMWMAKMLRTCFKTYTSDVTKTK